MAGKLSKNEISAQILKALLIKRYYEEKTISPAKYCGMLFSIIFCRVLGTAIGSFVITAFRLLHQY
jgi:hypothetical protein